MSEWSSGNDYLESIPSISWICLYVIAFNSPLRTLRRFKCSEWGSSQPFTIEAIGLPKTCSKIQGGLGVIYNLNQANMCSWRTMLRIAIESPCYWGFACGLGYDESIALKNWSELKADSQFWVQAVLANLGPIHISIIQSFFPNGLSPEHYIWCEPLVMNMSNMNAGRIPGTKPLCSRRLLVWRFVLAFQEASSVNVANVQTSTICFCSHKAISSALARHPWPWEETRGWFAFWAQKIQLKSCKMKPPSFCLSCECPRHKSLRDIQMGPACLGRIGNIGNWELPVVLSHHCQNYGTILYQTEWKPFEIIISYFFSRVFFPFCVLHHRHRSTCAFSKLAELILIFLQSQLEVW